MPGIFNGSHLGLGALNLLSLVDSGAVAQQQLAPSVRSGISAASARYNICTSVCTHLSSTWPGSYNLGGCRTQCVASPDVSPILAVCEARHGKGARANACAARGGNPLTGEGAGFPSGNGVVDAGNGDVLVNGNGVVTAGLFSVKNMLIGAAVIGVGYFIYKKVAK